MVIEKWNYLLGVGVQGLTVVCTALHQFAQALVVLAVQVDHGLHTSAMVAHKRDVHSQGSQGREVPQGVVLLGDLLEGQAQSLGFVQDNQDGPNQENLKETSLERVRKMGFVLSWWRYDPSFE